MRIFIVHAHPEPKSFNAAMTCTATDALTAGGHDVVVSDLYAPLSPHASKSSPSSR
jgi:NAD(P)H dehydrogenase (quinone)